MKKLLSILVIGFTLMSGTAYAEEKPSPLTQTQAIERLQAHQPVYSCSMKTNWFSDKPGQCPCCTLDLEKVTAIKDGNAVFGQDSMKGMDMKMMEKK